MSEDSRTEELTTASCSLADPLQPIRLVTATIDSTNAWARRLLEISRRSEYSLPSLDLIAESQMAGRGRQGRLWVSPPGSGLYASLLRRLPRGEIARLPLTVSVALADALRPWVEVGLKWPNDLLVEGRKLGGVLIESIGYDEAQVSVIIGFGINRTDEPSRVGAEPERPSTAVSMGELGATPSLEELATACLTGVHIEFGSDSSLESLVARYRKLSVHAVGDKMRCESGQEVISGRFAGFNAQGWIRLQTEHGPRDISSGEIVEA